MSRHSTSCVVLFIVVSAAPNVCLAGGYTAQVRIDEPQISGEGPSEITHDGSDFKLRGEILLDGDVPIEFVVANSQVHLEGPVVTGDKFNPTESYAYTFDHDFKLEDGRNEIEMAVNQRDGKETYVMWQNQLVVNKQPAAELRISTSNTDEAESSNQALILAGIIVLGTGLIGAIIFVSIRRPKQQSEPKTTQTKKHAEPPAKVNPRPSTTKQPSAPQRPRTSNPWIFLSYRRSDSADVTGRIYDRLVQAFGNNAVFKDVDSIPLGVDFRQHLDTTVSKSRVLLVVIGDGWLKASEENHETRLSDPRDFVRIEIESALQREIPIVPILVRGAKIPDESQLPDSLARLVYRNGMPIRPDPDFHRDMDRLIAALGRGKKKDADH